MARIASWVSIALLWGWFGALLMSPVTVGKPFDVLEGATEDAIARDMIAVTLLAVIAGIRGFARQSSS